MRKLIALSLVALSGIATARSGAVVPAANVVFATVDLFVTDNIHVVAAAPVQFINLDPVRGPHNVTSVEQYGKKGRRKKPYFQSATIGPGVTSFDVHRLTRGKTYHFICSIHPQMKGTLTVDA
jgi:plastocyanin